jgi:hypothetical protein
MNDSTTAPTLARRPSEAELPTASAHGTLAASRNVVVFASALACPIAYGLNAIFRWGWPAATAVAVGMVALFVAHAVLRRDGLIARLLLAGLAGAVMNLVNDWYCVRTGSIHYSPGGPFVLFSPFYVLLLFVGGTVQLGYASHLIDSRRGPVAAALLTAVLGALYVPFYDYLARAGDLWTYRSDVLLLGVVPRYIVVTEVMLCVSLSLLLGPLDRRHWAWAVPLGLVFGAVVNGSVILGHALLP